MLDDLTVLLVRCGTGTVIFHVVSSHEVTELADLCGVSGTLGSASQTSLGALGVQGLKQ